MGKYKFQILVGGVLWLIWICSALPLLVIILEFGKSNLENCGNEAWYFARFYSHMFIYPATFGLLSTICLTSPFINTVRHLCHPDRRPIGYIVLAVILLVIVFAGKREFGAASEAIWSFTPASLSDIDDGKEARNLFTNLCDDSQANESNPDQKQEQKQDTIEDVLNRLDESDLAVMSWTHIAYSVGFVAMGVLFLLIFGTIVVLRIWGPLGNRTVPLVTLALFTASFWTLARIAFLTEKLQIYSKEPLLQENILIFLLFGSLYVTLASAVWKQITAYETFISIVIALAGLAVSLAALIISSMTDIEANWLSSFLVGLFGTRSSLSVYFAMILFWLIIFLPYILLTFKKELTNEDVQ